ncbi:hypothetical protein [Pandoraea apista]|uniref:Agglutinin receptor n=1 Tax=Pandoraea apista TaxID=93218 RepID=A0ABX9ZI66_9BURK|nr:hypothetical protein [Pandoraea apista]PTE02682.1 hypothetical protein C7830_00195 [Pandoraea apista]RRJ27552.1 hypothetical protein EIB05_21575 [Pandoraea apista]RRJ73157.1 hypothetical protein EIL82_21990 [Pandoraea apista]RSD06468.1 hypothetical protein EJB12_21580 [Pandoraea apista]RSD11289.1 hypothetical protein EIZ52_21565 [Pandoraea apista]
MTATTKTEVTALTVVERAAVALGSDKLHGDLVALAKKSADITEIKNAAGREQCHAAMMALANTRTSITKTGKAARDDANAFSKAVIAEEKRLIDLIEPEEMRLRMLRDGWDEAREAEKRAKAEAEARRIAAIREHIDDIRSIATRMVGCASHAIAVEIEDLEAIGITLDRFQELTGEAEAARSETLDKLSSMYRAALDAELEAARIKAEQEAEAARLAAEREELARLRAEAAQREAEAAAARAADEKRLAEERAAQEAELRAKREAQERELAAERAEADRLARERLAAEEAEMRAERERQAVEAKRIADERAELDRQQREREEAAAQAQRENEPADFIVKGPGRDALVAVLAAHYNVEPATVLHWFFMYDIPAAA